MCFLSVEKSCSPYSSKWCGLVHMLFPTGRATGSSVFQLISPVAQDTTYLSLHNGSPLGDRSPSHCACSDTNGLRYKAQHQHQHIWLVLTYNVGLFNVICNNVVNGLNVNIQGLS